MPLSDVKIRSLKPDAKNRKISDASGLHLLVTPAGSKLWRMAYRYGGKQKTLSFGAYPVVTLGMARDKRLEAKRKLDAGIDPGIEKKRIKRQSSIQAANTFASVAEELLTKKSKDGLAEITLRKKKYFLDMASKSFGSESIAEITAADILELLRRVEKQEKYETATRLRSAIGQVFRYAISTARIQTDPTFSLRGALVSPKVAHRAAITELKPFKKLIREIWNYSGSDETVIGLKLLAILYPRPGELRLAKWEEFDLDKGHWTIPAARMKMRKEHKKPLPKAAVSLLSEFNVIRRTDELLLPSITKLSSPISENTFNSALRRMGYDTANTHCSHGFRASASSILNESRKWSVDAIEAELSHQTGDEVRRAYHRAQYWDERVEMADWWAELIFSTEGG